MDEKRHKELKDYMHGIELKNIRSKIQRGITHGFHVIILLAGITLGFIIGMYYKEVSVAMNPKKESVINYRYINQIETSLTDKNQLMIIDKPTNTIFIYSDTCAIQWWKMVGEKQYIKATATESTKPTKNKR